MIKSLVMVGSMIMLTSCSQSNEKIWSSSLKPSFPKTLGELNDIEQTLPPSNQYCKTIEYMNQSSSSLSITSVYDNSFKIEANKMMDESTDLLQEVVEINCKKIAKSKGVKFGFEYDASRKTCMCAYGEKR